MAPEPGESRVVFAPLDAGGAHLHDDDRATPVAQNPLWQQDNVILCSVGVDIGSSGTQVVFSRLHLRRLGEDLTSRYAVIGRQPLYRSPVRFTPYLRGQLIDAERLGGIIDDAYTAAGRHPAGVDTGVVILTGEAARRRNAARIATVVSARAGEFVCASAGHHMEAMLAAYGSGAAAASYRAGSRILNVDIGGGTTKLALLERGRVLSTAAAGIGGRLHVVDRQGRLRRLEPAGRYHAARAGFTWSVGDVVASGDLDRVAAGMADLLVAAITRPWSAEMAGVLLTPPMDKLADISGIMFSGGVAEYLYGRESRDFGDLGRRLGAAVRRRLECGAVPFELLPAGECIRATVLGASQYTVQLSGNTSYISDPEALLPRRNLQVLRPDYPFDKVVDPGAIASAVRAHLTAFEGDRAGPDIALALSWSGGPSHERLLAFGRGLSQGLARRIAAGHPLYLVLDGDIALSLGSVLREELGVTGDLLVIDGLRLLDFDYIDLGRIRQPSGTVPVTIKSLVFGDAAPVPAPACDHDHGA
jgi:ethanolamine utilization protein EutA